MSTLTLQDAAAATGGRLSAAADPRAVIRRVRVDSRDVEDGTLFAAFAGERADGHAFAPQALAAGAVAVLASREVAGPALLVADVQRALSQIAGAQRDALESTRVIAVTGSAGKTTTKDLLADVLGVLGPTVAAAGSLNNDIGAPMTVLDVTDSTRFLVLEMGARAVGDIARLAAMARPHGAAVLNVGSAHLGQFGSRAAIARAKGELAEAAGDYVVLTADDPLVAGMASRARARVLTVSPSGDPGADLRAADIALDEDGRARFTLVRRGRLSGEPVRLHLVGAHQVGNALAAAAVGLAEGLDEPTVAQALSHARARSRWRMAVSTAPSGVVVVNDAYNANPESMAAALRTVAAMAGARGQRAVAVLGEMRELGEEASAQHEAVGRLAAQLGVQRLVAVGAGARPVQLAAGREASWTGQADWVAEAGEVAPLLRGWLRPGDVVLVKASRAVGLERAAEELAGAGAAP